MRRLIVLALVLLVAAGGVAAWRILRAETGDPVGEAAARLCGDLQRHRTGHLADRRLTEVSGVVAGRASRDVLWMHNDSGDTARIFAVAPDGHLLGTFGVAGARARDWEDIAAGTTPEGDPALYLADIGDNGAERPEIVVYRVPEPVVGSGPAESVTAPAERIRLRYPDGAHDAETLLADPLTGDLFVVTKDRRGRSGVYRAAAPEVGASGPIALDRAGELDLGAGGLATGGDVAPWGEAVVVRTYFSVFVWGRVGTEPLAETLSRPPCRAPRLTELRGEAIGFTVDGLGYYTVTEGEGAPVDLWRPSGQS